MSGDRPLAGRRIAVTRPEAGELREHLAELGAHVVHVPLIEIAEPADGGAALRQALARLAAFDWLAVTSTNGAARVGPYVADHPGLRLAAVGPATARVFAATAGRPVDLVATVPRVEGLLAEFPPAPARVLIAQADRAGPALADGLAAAGHHVEAVAAYRTLVRRPEPAELAELAGVEAVVFASGSAASGWVEALGSAAPSIVVAVGPVTARVARSQGLHVTHVAAAPDAVTVAGLRSPATQAVAGRSLAGARSLATVEVALTRSHWSVGPAMSVHCVPGPRRPALRSPATQAVAGRSLAGARSLATVEVALTRSHWSGDLP